MRLVVSLFLFVFITFLSAPTIISLIEKNTDVSVLYDLDEEEFQKDLMEICPDFKNEYRIPFVFYSHIRNSEIISENLSKHDNVIGKILSPPPELV